MSLKFHGLTKKYGKFYALRDFCAELTDGVYALLGPNGAGKSTLMNLIAGLLEPTDGYITYGDREIRAMGEEFRGMLGFMPQYPGFYPNFTALEIMQYLGEMNGLGRREARETGKELLLRVNLLDASGKRVGTFSGGMRQRLGLAQALINNPKVLLLDEPTAGLDPKERVRFRNQISELAQSRIVIFCTHIVSDIETIAKEVLLLHHGELAERGTVSGLTEKLVGRVWELCVSETDMERLQRQFSGSCRLISREGRPCLRIISDEKPWETAKECVPILEDIYLFQFGDVEQ